MVGVGDGDVVTVTVVVEAVVTAGVVVAVTVAVRISVAVVVGANMTSAKKNDREEVTYVYMGRIERGFQWREGYSRNGNTYPWITRSEARQEAEAEGKKAVFKRESP